MTSLPLRPTPPVVRSDRSPGALRDANPPEPARFWTLPDADLLPGLRTRQTGLTQAEAVARLAEDGPNLLVPPKRAPTLLRVLGKLKNPLILILLIATAISTASGDYASSVIVVIVIVASIALDFVQEERAHRTAESLRQTVAPRARVRRDGRELSVAADTLVVGDLVLLSAGNVVPADLRVIETRDLFVNQAQLTGEPYPVEKAPGAATSPEALEAGCAAFMGSAVVGGSATAVVCRTGAGTELGTIATSLNEAEPPTAFDRGIHAFGLLITQVTIVLVVFVLVALALAGRPMLESLLFAVALAVGLTPELLPAVVTVTLARGARRLAAEGVIVKRLRAVQDLGSLDVLCTDKTGTLTEAQIRLEAALDPAGQPSQRALELGWLNARHESGFQSPLDRAILNAVGGGEDEATLPEGLRGWTKVDELPFDFERRRVSILIDGPLGRLLVMKGAPEEVLAHCGEIEQGGEISTLTPDLATSIRARIEGLGRDGLRTLGVAWRPVPAGHDRCVIADEEALRFAGLLAFLDPPKVGAMEAIRAMEAIGIDVKIVTGDSEAVTRHLCGTVGFPIRDVLNGPELEAMDDAALAARADGADAFCRVNPGQKARVIAALRRRGHVVGYMGDGVNDAPSLHAADVGISVEGAVDVARDAATVLLLENHLNVLLTAVREGRRTFANVRKYIQMGTSSNFGNMFSMAFAAALLPFLPMLPVQILVNNLLYDIANLALPVDEVDEEELATPQQWDITSVRRFMLMLGPVSSIFDLLTFAVLYWVFHLSEAAFQAGWFVESMATQTLVIFVIRTRKVPWRSRPARALVVTTLGVVAVAALLPFTPLRGPLGFALPPAGFWPVLVGLVAAYLIITEVFKRRYYRSFAG